MAENWDDDAPVAVAAAPEPEPAPAYPEPAPPPSYPSPALAPSAQSAATPSNITNTVTPIQKPQDEIKIEDIEVQPLINGQTVSNTNQQTMDEFLPEVLEKGEPSKTSTPMQKVPELTPTPTPIARVKPVCTTTPVAAQKIDESAAISTTTVAPATTTTPSPADNTNSRTLTPDQQIQQHLL